MNFFRFRLLLLVILLAGCSISEDKQKPGILVHSDWLQNELAEPDLLLMHVGTEEIYDSTHIPGARFLDPYLFTVSEGELRNELPSLDSIRRLLGALGVQENSRIILYYETQDLMTRTSRVYFTLDKAGLGDRTYVLNGGLPGWTKGLRPVTGRSPVTGVTEVTGLTEVTGDKKVVIRAQELNQERWNPDYVIVDSRSADEYYGEVDSAGLVATGGHVEGAYFLDYHQFLSDTAAYLFKDDEDLLKEFNMAGMDREKTAVFYCGSGVRASLSYLVARHLGYPALLYDGSIQEWEMLELPLTSPVLPPDNK